MKKLDMSLQGGDVACIVDENVAAQISKMGFRALDTAPRLEPETLSVGDMARRAQITRKRADDDDDRTVEVAFSSEAPVRRWFGYEVLGHDDGEIDLSRLQTGVAPLLKDHQNSVDAKVGRVARAWVEGKRGRAVIEFSKTAAGDEYLERVRSGDLTEISVGYRISAVIREKEEEDTVTYRVTEWMPFEISLVAVPADASVGVGRSESNREVPVKRKRKTGMDPEDEIITPTPNENGNGDGANVLELNEGQRVNDPNPTTPTGQRAPAAPAAPVAALADPEALIRAERERVADINALAAKFNIPADKRDESIRSGVSVEAFRGKILDHLGEEGPRAFGRDMEVGLNEREIERFSFRALIAHQINPTNRALAEAAAMEIEICEAAARLDSARSVQGSLVPTEVFGRGQRNMTVGSATAGGNMVGTALQGTMIDFLENYSFVARRAQVIDGLVGNIDIPRKTGKATVTWGAENADANSSNPTVGLLSLRSKQISGVANMSRQLLLNATPSVEAMVREDLIEGIGLGVDLAAMYGAGGNAPTGIVNTVGVGSVTFGAAVPDHGEIIDLESDVATANADTGALAYALNPTMRGALKQTTVDAGSGRFVFEGAELNGHMTEVTNQVTAGDVIFGNWGAVVLAFWSGVDVWANPYRSANGSVDVFAFQNADVGVRTVGSFSVGNDGV